MTNLNNILTTLRPLTNGNGYSVQPLVLLSSELKV